ncbi:NosD domain-containing protein [Haloferax profundi]|uniref:Periplasmic copper-binding protein NosD beta helix domain-containing protein n=1 Tax=Haloferax profundi TaxID=1544718 RepID=A0A0W1SLD4_9EURY|nr:NosD domain-containing protein [Haloferax profundi]KTG26997.1 hypothetical protein AUR66_15215 [Haloferax profundi]
MRRPVLVAVVGVLLVSLYVAPFAVGSTASPHPVPFGETVESGLSVASVRSVQADGGVVPKAQVSYAQYEPVVGYYGVESAVETFQRDGRDQRFGPPIAVFVSDFSGTTPSPTENGYVNVSSDPGWVDARDAHFVVSESGESVVVPFSDRSEADAYATRVDGAVWDWNRLVSTLAVDRGAPDYESRVADRSATATTTADSLRQLTDRPVSVVVGDDAPTIVDAVERAPPNTTVVVPEGTYTTQVSIEKPVTLRGSGVETVVDGGGNGSVLTVNASGVAITDLRITGVGTATIDVEGDAEGWDSVVERTYGRGDAGVAILGGSRVLVSRVRVVTPSNGVLVRDADDVVVSNVTVRGDPAPGAGYMGVMAMRSPVVVQDSTFAGGLDAVYAHRADGLVVRNSTMRDARFGVHLMFTSDALVADNVVRDTSTGVVVMTRPSGIALVGNDVRESNHGIVTAGADSYVARNVLVDDGVGLKIGSRTSSYTENVVARNDVGVEAASFVASNRVVGNDFVANGRHARATSGPLRLWSSTDSGNYWDTAVGLGPDGSLSRPYRPTDPLDARLDERGTTTLARSPALTALRALQGAVPGMRAGGIVDSHPEPDPVNPALVEQALNDSLP